MHFNRPRYILFYIIVCFIPIVWGAGLLSSQAQSPSFLGVTYFSDLGGDLNRVIERHEIIDATGEFIIEMNGPLPQKNATVVVHSFDVDSEQGEQSNVFFNGHLIGVLSGHSDTWETNTFEVQKELVVPGPNQVRFVLSDTLPHETTNWAIQIDGVKLLIDGGSPLHGSVTKPELNLTTDADANKLIVTSVLDASGNGTFKLDLTLMDAAQNPLQVITQLYNMKKGESIVVSHTFEDDAQIPTGTHTVVATLFYQQGESWIQQSSESRTYIHLAGSPSSIGVPMTQQIVPLIKILEDSPPIQLDLSLWFTQQGNKNMPTEERNELSQSIPKKLGSPTNPTLLHAMIEGNTLIIQPQPNQFGETDIPLIATLNQLSTEAKIRVEVSPVEDPVIVKNPISLIQMKEDDPNLKISLEDLFFSPDVPFEQLIIRIGTPSNTELLFAKVEGKSLLIHLHPDQSGSSIIPLYGAVGSREASTLLTVNVDPVDDGMTQIKPFPEIRLSPQVPQQAILLSEYFNDIDSPIKFDVQSNKKQIKLQLIEDSLLIRTSSLGDPEAILHLTAHSGGESVTQQIPVKINGNPPRFGAVFEMDKAILSWKGSMILDKTNEFLFYHLGGVYYPSSTLQLQAGINIPAAGTNSQKIAQYNFLDESGVAHFEKRSRVRLNDGWFLQALYQKPLFRIFYWHAGGGIDSLSVSQNQFRVTPSFSLNEHGHRESSILALQATAGIHAYLNQSIVLGGNYRARLPLQSYEFKHAGSSVLPGDQVTIFETASLSSSPEPMVYLQVTF